MFPTTTFRHRLLGLVAVPTVALIGLTALAVRPRLDDFRSSGDDATVIDVVAATTRYLIQLGEERTVTVRRAAGAGVKAAELDAERERTDAAAALFLRQVERLDGEEPGPVRTNAVFLTENIGSVRAKADGGTSAEDQWRNYNALADSVLAFYRQVTVASANADQVRTGSTLANLVETKERWSRGGNLVDITLSEKKLNSARLAEFVALERQGDQTLAAFSAAADTDIVRTVQNRLLTDGTEADRLVRKVIDAGNADKLPDVKAATWAAAENRRLAVLSEQASPLFERLRITAANEKANARTTAMLFALAGLGAIFASVGLSLFIGRRLAERLRRMSSQAESIASDRLPEVLAALRSPSAESLASTLPQVEPGRMDEIGVIAESFNTVLRTAVATSIEHSQQRSKTLTDMLINLGRRNQALIDRQLELIDRMESTQKDVDVLEQLFKLDHMVTRMRRNAENLLVLASDKVVRPWSTPVTVAEILQAATSETADLSRVRLELSAGDARSIPGRMAVDLSHLVAELVENALTYSPPSTLVTVRTDAPEGDLRIWVRDAGVGMSDEEMDDVNARIAAPPEIDQLTTDQIGFQVVGRLARRMGVTVWLQPNGTNGVAASIVVPALLLAELPAGGRAAAAETSRPAEPSRQADSARPNLGRVERPSPERAAAAALSATLPLGARREAAVTAIRETAEALTAAPLPTRTAPPVSAPAAPVEPAPTVAVSGPSASAAPVAGPGGTTTSGLVRRQPGAAVAQPAAALAAAAGTFQRLPVPGAESAPAPTAEAPVPPPAAPAPAVTAPEPAPAAAPVASAPVDAPTGPRPATLFTREMAAAMASAPVTTSPAATVRSQPSEPMPDAAVHAAPPAGQSETGQALPSRVPGAAHADVAAGPSMFARMQAPAAASPAPAAPAPIVRSQTTAEPAAPATTANGLVRRTPSAPVPAGAAMAAEAGQFRRLPVPGEEPPAEDEVALSRSRLLRDLRAGLRRGADETADAPAAPTGDS